MQAESSVFKEVNSVQWSRKAYLCGIEILKQGRCLSPKLFSNIEDACARQAKGFVIGVSFFAPPTVRTIDAEKHLEYTPSHNSLNYDDEDSPLDLSAMHNSHRASPPSLSLLGSHHRISDQRESFLTTQNLREHTSSLRTNGMKRLRAASVIQTSWRRFW